MDNRARNWWTIGYPESLLENWIDVLESMAIPFVVSPLHDKDINAEGGAKKPHYHILFTFAGKKTYEQVKDICDSIKAVIPQRVENTVSAVRYFCHTDNKDKVKYDISDIQNHSTIDISSCFQSKADDSAIFLEMIDFIIDNDICEFYDFVVLCRECMPEWVVYLSKHNTYSLINFIKSNRHRKRA